MNNKEALRRVEKYLYKPTCALLGLTLSTGLATVADRNLITDPSEVAAGVDVLPLETPNETGRLELPERASVNTTVPTAPPVTAPAAEPVQQEIAPTPIEQPTGVSVPVPPPVESIPPPANALVQEPATCPVAWDTISQGVCYSEQADFHVLRVDTDDPNISVCPAYTVKPGRLGSLNQAARRMGAVAAINSSFFYKNGRTLGPLACDGQWISRDPYPQIVLEYHTDGTVKTQHSENALQGDASSMRFAVSGSHVLVNDGQVTEDFGKDNKSGVLYKRHDRTAIAMDDGGQLFMAVTETGNKVTMPQLARFMGSLGVSHALNLDGGGSSQMEVHYNNVAYRGETERRVSTGLFVVANS